VGGIQANIIFGHNQRRDSGYLRYIMQMRVVNGKMTERDFMGVKKWFKENCPDGW